MDVTPRPEVALKTSDDGIVQLVNADCIAGMRQIPDASVDCVLTDPPYAMGYVSARRKRSPRFEAIENDGKFDLAFNVRWLSEAHRVMKDDTHLYVFTDDGNLGAWRDVIGKCGFTVKRTLVWVKNAWTSGDLEGDYGHQTEFVVFAHKGRRHLSGNRIGNVLDARRVDPNALQHPTQKPVEVLTPLIECSTEPGGVLLDPFIGSGTTAVAARALGRRCIGFEIDETYYETAVARTAQRSLLEEGA